MINLVVQNTVDQTMGILKLFAKTSMVNLPLYVCAANHDIVPYNPNMLLLLYEYHIYVEDVVTSANNIVQYIYKYITRNALFTRAKIGTAINDIE